MIPVKRNKQGVNIRSLVKLKETATETFMLLYKPYGEDALSRACAHAWYKSFSEGTEDTEDYKQPGSLVMMKLMKMRMR